LIQGGALGDYTGTTGRDDEQIEISACHKLSIGGVKGMCGLPYVFDNTGVKFICGIHVAGTELMSVIAPIYTSDFESIVEQQCLYEPVALGEFVLPDADLLLQFKPGCKPLVVEETPLPSPAGMRTIGKSSHNFVGPSVTKLRKSIVALSDNCPFEDNLAPAKLKPFYNDQGEYISPMNISFKKFENKMLKELPPDFHHPSVAQGIFTPDKPWDRLRKLTIEEAINGVPEWGNLHAIDMDTSPGVGYVNIGVKRKDLFDKQFSKRYGREVYVPKIVLQDQLDRMIRQVEQGFIPRCMALGLTKDEKRTLDRVLRGASRLFYAADLVHLIVSRVYLGGLLSASETNPSQTDIMVGINPLGPEWSFLWNRISKAGKWKITSTDIEGWDINFCLFCVLIFCRLLRRQFPHLASEFVRGITCMLWSSVMPFVFIGAVVFWMWIMCSGTLATSWFNSASNSMLHRALFNIMRKDYLLTPDFGKLPEKSQDFVATCTFDEAVASGFFGDDNSQGVHPLFEGVYNGQTLSEYRKLYLNWVTTDPEKGKDIKPFDQETMLLKRGFRKDGSYVKGPLDAKAIEGMIMWFNKGENPDHQQQAINIHVALRESYYHGREYFEKMHTLMVPYLRELSARSGQDHSFVATYDDLDAQFEDQFF
jgi:hypothetical protein